MLGMQMEWTAAGDATILRLRGRMDAVSAMAFEKDVQWACDSARVLIVDMTNLEYLSSAGLRSVMVVAKRMKARGGKLRFFGLNQLVNEIFECAGLLSSFAVFKSEAEAIAAN